MIAAFDVHYPSIDRARAAAVIFDSYSAAQPDKVLNRLVAVHAGYIPGSFYLRELPCIMSLLRDFEKMPAHLIIDGYVDLDDKPGLGQQLYQALDRRSAVIGVAKSAFKNAPAREVFRGRSRRPLYVTAAGMSVETAARNIQRMHGAYRIPTLLRQVDLIARGL